MPRIDFAKRELLCKIVYYGPGLSGKSTNLQYIRKRTLPDAQPARHSFSTEIERILTFDLLTPVSLGPRRNLALRLLFSTVPGHVFYNTYLKQVLKGVDAIVFVADSQEERLDADLESLDHLRTDLADQGHNLDAMPWVLQYNKQDLPSAMSLADLDRELNPTHRPSFAAVASEGKGVFEPLKACVKNMVRLFPEGVRPPSSGSDTTKGSAPIPLSQHTQDDPKNPS